MGKYKLLAIDIDGTLIRSDQTISPRTRTALIQAQEQGVQVVITTGRPTFGAAPFADELRLADFGSHVISFNGSEIYNWKTKERIHSVLLDEDIKPYIYHCAKQKHFQLVAYIGQNVVAEDPNDEYVQFSSTRNKMPIRPVQNFLTETENAQPKFLIVGDPDPLHELELEMAVHLKGKAEVYRSEPFFLEIVPNGIDKATGLAVLLSKLNLTKEEIIAFGDGFNDVAMIEYAGLGIAMGNAQQVVKDHADYITLSNEQDGIAEAVEKFIFASTQ